MDREYSKEELDRLYWLAKKLSQARDIAAKNPNISQYELGKAIDVRYQHELESIMDTLIECGALNWTPSTYNYRQARLIVQNSPYCSIETLKEKLGIRDRRALILTRLLEARGIIRIAPDFSFKKLIPEATLGDLITQGRAIAWKYNRNDFFLLKRLLFIDEERARAVSEQMNFVPRAKRTDVRSPIIQEKPDAYLPPLVFFHVSAEYREEFTSVNLRKPTSYWFGDKIFCQNGLYDGDYVYLFVKNPKRDRIQLCTPQGGYRFDALYKQYLLFEKYRPYAKMDTSPKPIIHAPHFVSFSKIKPDMVMQFNKGRLKILKPESYKGVKLRLLLRNRSNNTHISRSELIQHAQSCADIRAITDAVPELLHAYPVIAPEKRHGRYEYKDWQRIPISFDKAPE